MPKKRTKNRPKIKRSKWRKFVPWTLLASALLVGAFAIPANLLNQNDKKTPPKIDSISPSPIIVGKEFTVTGSGFTTEEEFKGPKGRPRGVISFYPGNWYQIKGIIGGPAFVPEGSPAYSPDGKTVKFKLNLNARDIPKDCFPGTTGKVCQIPFQVVNGYGVVSNVYQTEVFIPDKPPIYSTWYAVDSPTNINVTPGTQNFEIMKIKAKADAQNILDITFTDMIFQTGPVTQAIDCYKTFGYITAFEVESGQQVGIGAMAPNWFNPGCIGMFQLNPRIILPPGTEKTILIKMDLKTTAPVGLQFNLGGGPVADDGGWVDYPGPEGSYPTITIVAP